MDKLARQLKDFSDTPELDIRYFLEENPSDIQLQSWIERRKKGEPVAKIIGHKGFWKREFFVSGDTLDPRPDSETMINFILTNYSDEQRPLRFLDLGTGTGCLLLSLLDEYPLAEGVGMDISEKALKIARKNAAGCKRVRFVKGDFSCPDAFKDLGQFDVILSNPPYIPTDEIARLDVDVKNYDPLLALDGGKDGLDAYRVLAKNLSVCLKKGGRIFFEIGQGQRDDVWAIMKEEGFSFCGQACDLSGIIRILGFFRYKDLSRVTRILNFLR